MRLKQKVAPALVAGGKILLSAIAAAVGAVASYFTTKFLRRGDRRERKPHNKKET